MKFYFLRLSAWFSYTSFIARVCYPVFRSRSRLRLYSAELARVRPLWNIIVITIITIITVTVVIRRTAGVEKKTTMKKSARRTCDLRVSHRQLPRFPDGYVTISSGLRACKRNGTLRGSFSPVTRCFIFCYRCRSKRVICSERRKPSSPRRARPPSKLGGEAYGTDPRGRLVKTRRGPADTSNFLSRDPYAFCRHSPTRVFTENYRFFRFFFPIGHLRCLLLAEKQVQ